MYLKIADPSHYPFGMLSIYYREFGYCIAEDAARMAVPKELRVTFPAHDDNTYFPILEANYQAAIQTFVEQHAIAAALHRVKKFFMGDAVGLRQFSAPPPGRYGQQLHRLAWEPVDPSTQKCVDVEEVAFVVAAVRRDIRNGVPVKSAPYQALVQKYLDGKNLIEAPLADIAEFTDLDRLVETALELEGCDRREAAIRRRKEQLMDSFLNKTLAEHYPHLTQDQYDLAKRQQFLRVRSAALEEKLFTMWRNGYLPEDSTADVPEIEPEQQPPAAPSAAPPLESFPRLTLDYRYPFIYQGTLYQSPIECGLRRALALFCPKLAETTPHRRLRTELARLSLDTLKTRLRRLIYTFVLDRCRTPPIWVLLNYPDEIEWKGHAGIVGERWLTAMYRVVRRQAARPASLSKPLRCSDLSENPLLREWMMQRVRMWKPVANKHHDLFAALAATYIKPTFRFPTFNEKYLLTGCAQDVWSVIISEFEERFVGTAEEVYRAVVGEIGDPLAIRPTFQNLCRLFTPIFEKDNLDYARVNDMVAAILNDFQDVSLRILWIRFFSH